MKFERHPLSKLWPDIPESQFLELKEDIHRHGQVYPITVYDKQIIDGWHRYRACSELGVKPQTNSFHGSPEQAADLVNSLNAHRRNVADGIRAFAVTGSYTWAQGCAKGGGGGTGAPPPDTKTNSEMATIAGTSETTVKQAKRVHQEGSKPLKEAVKSGAVSVKKAASVVDLPKSEQLAAAKKQPEKPAAPATNLDEKWEPDADEEAAHEAMEKEYAASIDKVMEADDKLSAAHKEIKRQAAEIAMLKQRRDGFQNERIEAIQLCKKLQRENDRLRNQLEKKAA